MVVEGDANGQPRAGLGFGPPPPTVMVMYGEPPKQDVEDDAPSAGLAGDARAHHAERDTSPES